MSDTSPKCKAKKCNKKATKDSGFCGWCQNKYIKGILLPDGRESKLVCKSKFCQRPSKKNGFCGWCYKKYLKGSILADGSFSSSEEKRIAKQKKLEEKKARRKAKAEIADVKYSIKSLINYDKLKVLQNNYSDYRVSKHCPYLQIMISPAACFNRIFLYDYAPKKCKKCDQYDGALVELKQRIKDI